MLNALITAVTLMGCHGAGGGGGAGLGGYIDLDGSLTGLVGSGLTLQNDQNSIAINGPGDNAASWEFFAVGWYTSYDLTVATQPTNPSQTCVVANGTGTTGGLGSTVTNITVTCTTNPPRFVYVANRGSNNVSAYTVDAGNGTLAPIPGSPFAAGNLPVAIAVDPTGTYAYVVNQTDATISAFTIDRTSGALTAVSGSPFPTGATPSSVTVDPFSLYVYVTNQADGTVSEFTINFSNGALTAVSGSPFPAGTGPRAVTVDPSDSYVYVANATSNTLSGYTGDTKGNDYTIGDASGAITAISGSPYRTGSSPNSVAVDPLDNFLYVANEGSNDISAYSLGAGGTLTALTGSPFTAGNEPSALAVDPTGSFLYVANSSGTVSVFAITAASGALSTVSGSPYTAGTLPSAIAISD